MKVPALLSIAALAAALFSPYPARAQGQATYQEVPLHAGKELDE